MYCSALYAIGHSGTTTMRKISVKAESASVSAISFGLRWRMAPSTSAIIRSRNDSPAPVVMRTTIRSDSDGRAASDTGTVAARFANHGRRFAGDRRLIDRGNAFDDFAVAGNDLSCLDHDSVAGPQLGRGNFFDAVAARGDRPSYRGGSRSDSACALPRASANAVAKLANSTVRKSQTSSAMKYSHRLIPSAHQAASMRTAASGTPRPRPRTSRDSSTGCRGAA